MAPLKHVCVLRQGETIFLYPFLRRSGPSPPGKYYLNYKTTGRSLLTQSRASLSFYIKIIFILLCLRPSTARPVCIRATPALRGPGHSAGGQQADSRCPVKKSSACANQKITLVLRSRISYDSQGVADYILARPENINYDIINSLSTACPYCICLYCICLDCIQPSPALESMLELVAIFSPAFPVASQHPQITTPDHNPGSQPRITTPDHNPGLYSTVTGWMIPLLQI